MGWRRSFDRPNDSTPDDNNVDMDQTALIRGTFDGVGGHYQCTGSACTVDHDGAGYLFDAGTWTFRTSKNAKVGVPDDGVHVLWVVASKDERSRHIFLRYVQQRRNDTGDHRLRQPSGVGDL